LKILIVEDDSNILSLLKDGFEEENYIVEIATNGGDGEYLASMNRYDVIILDWMLPELSGIEVLSKLRQQDIRTPVIMLTAKDEIKYKIEGLQQGADDYLSKPFSFLELQARVEALFRRSFFEGSNIIQIKDVTIDTVKKVVKKGEKIVELSAKEYELLIFLVKNKNAYVSKFMIEEQLWSSEETRISNVIEVTIFKLRKKLSKDFIKNFKGLGYKVETY
jgi:DNA-binding response OmpR family regulator